LRFSFSVVDGCDLPYFGVTYLPVLDDRQLLPLPPDEDPFLLATVLTSFLGFGDICLYTGRAGRHMDARRRAGPDARMPPSGWPNL